MRGSRVGLMAVGLAAVVVAALANVASATLTPKELSCSAAVAKNFAKLQMLMLKTTTKCRGLDLAGKVDDPNDCDPLPAASLAKVNALKAKFIGQIAAACSSVCSISNDKTCISDQTCPPKHTATPANNFIAERCLGKGGTAPFNIRNLDWPGPYCEAILGHALQEPGDLGQCLATLADRTVNDLTKSIYGPMNQASGVSATAVKCAGAIGKSVMRAAGTAYVPVASCRDARRSTYSDTPYDCPVTDTASESGIATAVAAVSDAIAKSCTDADIAGLPGLCASGGLDPTSVAQAQACIGDMIREIASEEHAPSRHQWGAIGMLNVTHPDSAKAWCGDGIVTTTREEHTGVGEECDIGADSACPGECLPPGDLFECTCGDRPRERFVVDGARTDSDAGWKGSSHNATHNDGFGYLSELSDCDCTDFTQATCTGTSSDPICNVRANMAPRCSDDLNGTLSCDERGNNNGVGENWDCFRCDDNSINAGDFCANGANANETACQSQCFDDATGIAVTPQLACLTQADCGEGRTCKGRCDNTLTCNTMTEGSPLPQVSASISVCIVLEYKTDITGTKNMVTGESSLSYTTRSNIQLGTLFTVPCPVCGGVCVGGSNDGDTCNGRCAIGGGTCIVDTDCTDPGDSCSESAADCTGGSCSLDLRCSDGPNQGRLCSVDAATPLGVMSHNCPPDPGSNLSGRGVLQINGGPVTSEPVEFGSAGACTDSTWHNYDCECPADAPGITGVPTKPNGCAAVCDAGPNEGRACAVGANGSGTYTTCVGGSDAGYPCDENSDCEGGSCNSVIRECVGGWEDTVGAACANNGDCNGGGTCEEPCPGARCVPLCYSEGKCNGGARDGDLCAQDKDCSVCKAGNTHLIGYACQRDEQCNTGHLTHDGVCGVEGGVTCDLFEPEEGLCAAGPEKLQCTGAGFTTLPCVLNHGQCLGSVCTEGSSSKIGQACSYAIDCLDNGVPIEEGCEAGDDGILGNADDHAGAGQCKPRPQDCYVDNGRAEGGDTLNGNGSPSDVKLVTAFCTPPNGSTAIDDTSGFGGPSRVRRHGSAYVNVEAIQP